MTRDRNAVLLMRSLENPRMSFRSMVAAGMLPTPFKLGWSAFLRFFFGMVLFLEKKNRRIMGKTPHWYGWMIGVRPDKRGIGKLLLNHCFQIADKENLPIYLETATKNNVEIFSSKGFSLHESVYKSAGDFSLYFMVRPPQNDNHHGKKEIH